MIGVVARFSFGWVGYCRTEAGLWALTLPQADRFGLLARLRALAAGVPLTTHDGLLDSILLYALEAYFSGRPASFADIPVDWSGYTPFAQAVLAACRTVPFGRTCTYGELARLVGKPHAARAVGNALRQNRTPLVVPCHRIIRADGSPGGFAGGREWKERFLALERKPG